MNYCMEALVDNMIYKSVSMQFYSNKNTVIIDVKSLFQVWFVGF
jgi:hypothetical protein